MSPARIKVISGFVLRCAAGSWTSRNAGHTNDLLRLTALLPPVLADFPARVPGLGRVGRLVGGLMTNE